VENLYNKFIRALQDTSGITNNSYLTFLKDAVEKVSNASQSDQVLTEYNQSLLAVVTENNFALDPEKTNEFSQILGEAHFYLLCKNKGVSLTRIKEGVTKTPDFKFEQYNMYFEVKTLSVVSGHLGIKESLEDSMDAQIEIERQLKQGNRIATGVSVTQPYGKKPYQKGKGTVTAVIETLIEKIKQNIKLGQFQDGKTFLVINLSIIPPFRTKNYVLRPAYHDDYMFSKAVSGELWMMAFGREGAPILGIPEFEGKPGVESTMTKLGILSNPEYEDIAGILLMIHPWNEDSSVWGLYTYDKFISWVDNEPDIAKTLSSITGNNWNDDRDTNGWQLNG
jgi:hypothetical protein